MFNYEIPFPVEPVLLASLGKLRTPELWSVLTKYFPSFDIPVAFSIL